MNPQEWKVYVDTGEVPYHFFKSMVESIKKGERLNQQHLAVYQSHGKVIEVLLSKS
ncbi:hypothetical protein OAE73_00875 [bacterium]|nr:hypothetical protein [bacterium]